jgi:putative FmdB family regulatory protein
MPIYGYRCSECGRELEVFQHMSDEPLKVCGDCGGQLRKLLYPVGVQFKGSGFYSTDYKKNGGKSESKDGASGESSSSSESGKSESGKSESTTSEKSSSSEKKSESVASKET